MRNYFATTFIYGYTLFKRLIRDPLTTIILVGIPVILLLIFGLFVGGGTDDINIRTALINQSNEPFAQEYASELASIDVLSVNDDISLTEARDQMSAGDLDTIIELPAQFGAINEDGVPTGDAVLYVDATDNQTSDILMGILTSVNDELNRHLLGTEMPLGVATESVNVTEVQPIHQVFAIFMGLGLMMAGFLGITSTVPSDKKQQILRRLHVTPMRPSQTMLGVGLAFFAFGISITALMLIIAIFLFDMTIAGGWLTLLLFICFGLIAMIGLGLAIAGIAKNPTQGEGIGQVVFLASMALSGIWLPVALMPEFLQNIVAFMPLTPVIDGMRNIIVENAGFADILPQLAVIGGWIVVTYIVGFKVFRWE